MKMYPDPDVVTQNAESSGSGANTAEVITLAAATDDRRVIDGIYWSYDAASTTGGITIAIDGTDEFDVDVIRAAADNDQILFERGFYATDVNEAVVVTLKAAGGTTNGKLNIVYR